MRGNGCANSAVGPCVWVHQVAASSSCDPAPHGSGGGAGDPGGQAWGRGHPVNSTAPGAWGGLSGYLGDTITLWTRRDTLNSLSPPNGLPAWAAGWLPLLGAPVVSPVPSWFCPAQWWAGACSSSLPSPHCCQQLPAND